MGGSNVSRDELFAGYLFGLSVSREVYFLVRAKKLRAVGALGKRLFQSFLCGWAEGQLAWFGFELEWVAAGIGSYAGGLSSGGEKQIGAVR